MSGVPASITTKSGDHDQVQVGLRAPEGEFAFKTSAQASVQHIVQSEDLVREVFDDGFVPEA
jgi:hypothetical protein